MWTRWKSSVYPATSTPSNAAALSELMPLFFLLVCRGRRQSGPCGTQRQERYLKTKHPWSQGLQAGTLKMSPSLQFMSTWPAPSTTEAKTWTWWVCPSGKTSGSSTSRCTHPQERTRLRPRCRNSSWGRLESRDTLFPFRSGNIFHFFVWFYIALPSYAKAFSFYLFQMPTDLPCSVYLQSGPNDSGKVPFPWPICVVHTHLDYLTVHCLRICFPSGLRRGLWGQSIPGQCSPQCRWGHREEVGLPRT